MKKTFQLTDPKKAPARQVEAVKNEINKYIAREKRKELPAGADYWDFDCRMGATPENTSVIFVNEIKPKIDKYVADGKESFYLELLVKPMKHAKRER